MTVFEINSKNYQLKKKKFKKKNLHIEGNMKPFSSENSRERTVNHLDSLRTVNKKYEIKTTTTA